MGTAGINFGFVAALLIGGLLAAPLAAWLVSRLPAAILGVAVGGLVIITSLRTLTKSVSDVAAHSGVLRSIAITAWSLAIGWAIVRHLRERREAAARSEDSVRLGDLPDVRSAAELDDARA